METESSQAATSPGETAEVVRRELQAAYARAGEALKQKDAATLMQMVTPDFVQRMPDGTLIGFTESETVLREWFTTPDRVTDYATQVGALTVDGGEAVAIVDEKVTTAFADEAGQPHERVQANQARVTWVRTAKGWQIRRSEYLTAKMTIDGAAVPPLMVPPRS